MTFASRGSVLRKTLFMRALTGQTFGALADQLVPVVLTVFVIQHGQGIEAVAAVMSARTASLVVCLLGGGILADRFSRPKILVSADLVRTVVLFIMAALLDTLPVGGICAFAAVAAAGEAVSRPAFRSLIPQVLPDSLIERGNSLVSAGQRGALLCGALLGAWAVSRFGASMAIVLAGVGYFLSALTIVGLRVDAGQHIRKSFFLELKGGFFEVRSRPWVLAVMVTTCVHLLTATAASLTLLPVIAHDQLGGDAAYGVVLAAFAVGSLVAVVVTSWWRPNQPGLAAMLGLLMFAAEPLSLAVSSSLAVVVAGFAAGGFAVEFFFVQWLSALQRTIPGHALGKVLALDQLAAFSLLPLGYALVPLWVNRFGASATLVAAGVIVIMSIPLCLSVRGVSRFSDKPKTTSIQ